MFNKYLVITTLVLFQLMLVSCKSLLNGDFATLNCGQFVVKFSDESLEKKIFFSDLKQSLENKLKLITKKETTPNYINKCELYISVNDNKFPSMISNDGDISRENHNININYTLMAGSKKISKQLGLFYGTSISEYKYSNYIKNGKENKNNIENIAGDIFLDIIKQLK